MRVGSRREEDDRDRTLDGGGGGSTCISLESMFLGENTFGAELGESRRSRRLVQAQWQLGGGAAGSWGPIQKPGAVAVGRRAKATVRSSLRILWRASG